MKRLLLIVLVLFLALLAAHAAAARWAGVEAEREMRRLVADMQKNPGVEVRDFTYDRGWYASSASYTLVLPVGRETVRLAARDSIQHGPLLAGGDMGAALGLGQVNSALLLDGLPGNVVKGQLHVALNGRTTGEYTLSDLRLDLPAGDADLVNLVTGKGKARLIYDPRDGGIETRADLDSVTLTRAGDGYKAVFRHIRLEQQGRPLTRGLWAGKAQMDIGELRLDDGSGEPIALRDVALTAELEPRGQAFSGRISLAAEALQGMDLDAGPGRLALSFERIDISAWTRLQSLLAQAEAADDKTRTTLFLLNGFDLLQQFSRHGPRIAVDELFLDLGEQGRMEASASLDYPKDVKVNLFNPLVAVNALNARLDMALPRVLADIWAAREANEQLAAYRRETNNRLPEEHYAAFRQEQMERARKSLLDHPMIVAQGERLRSTLLLDQGQVVINDAPAGSLLKLLLP